MEQRQRKAPPEASVSHSKRGPLDMPAPDWHKPVSKISPLSRATYTPRASSTRISPDPGKASATLYKAPSSEVEKGNESGYGELQIVEKDFAKDLSAETKVEEAKKPKEEENSHITAAVRNAVMNAMRSYKELKQKSETK